MKSIFLGLMILATANIQMGPEQPDYGKEFGKTIVKASMRLAKAAQKRPLKIKTWNDSLEKTAKAAQLLAVQGQSEKVIELLEAARGDYLQNSFSYLLEAVLLNSQNRLEEANACFESFLLESRTFTEFEESFLHWGEFHMLRQVVYHILKSRGVTFEGREADIRIRVPYAAFIQYVMDPSREDWFLNLIFIFMIFGGGVALILASFAGIDFTATRAGTLIVIYLVIWIAYALWIFDLAFGLPFEWNRHTVVPVFLSSILGILFVCELCVYLLEKNRPLEEGYRRCPYCGGIIVELAIECSHCRQKV